MKLNIRATDLQVTPSDTSGYLVRIQCSDAEDVREQVLTGPDDGADDWPLAKRYREIVERSRGQQAIIAELRKTNTHLVEQRIRLSDGLLAAVKERNELRALLRETIQESCPACDMPDNEHIVGCEYAAALADKEENDG